MKFSLILCFLLSCTQAFQPLQNNPPRRRVALFESVEEATTVSVSVDPKEAVKLFGRLAEKYIMLDDSAGMCCYSACSDCEYRLPGGGYRMADQSAARPKWIPSYEYRFANGKEHASKWGLNLYDERTAVVKEEFVAAVLELDYAPPLGGPYVGASSAEITDTAACEAFFDALADGKTKLTKHRMSKRLKEFADGEEGLAWAGFQAALGIQ